MWALFDLVYQQLNNVLKILGLSEAANTLVGDGMIRGVSGGQKRRVTLGEMLLPPRKIKFLDAISNGLDAATTYDIVQSLKFITQALGLTTVVSLLQVWYYMKPLYRSLLLTRCLHLSPLFRSSLRLMCSTASTI